MKGTRVLKDIVIITIIAILVFILELYFELFEALKEWSGKHEDLEKIVNEFIVLFIILLAALIIFSLRRWRELEIEINLRRKTEEALRLSEEKYRTMIQFSNDLIWTQDNRGNFTYFNKRAEEISGYKPEDWLGKSFEPLILPADLPRINEIFFEALNGTSQSYEVNILRGNGSVFVLSVNTAPIFESGQVVGLVSFGRDITGQKHLEDELSREIVVNTALADLSHALLLTTSIDDISSLVLEYAKRFTNSRFGFVGYIDPRTGYLISPTLTRDIWDACQVKDKEIVFKKFSGLWGWVLNNRKPLITNSLEDDPRSTGIPSGHIPINRFISVPALLGETLVGQVSLANSVRNYTDKDLVVVERLAALYAIAVQRKRAEETITQLAYHDPLTGLPNRLLLNDRLSLAIGYADRNQQKLAVMMIDMDNFKDINDTLGHNTGDRLLKGVGERMVGLLRKTDTVARLGGDEFVLILPETTKFENLVKIADIILHAFKEYFVIDDHKIYITPSIGIAIFPDDGNDAETLVKNADIAMYQAKEQGKNRYSIYSGGI